MSGCLRDEMARMWETTGKERGDCRRTVPLFREGSNPELSLREVFLLLAARRRRVLLYRLANADGAVPVPELVAAVVADETTEDDGGRTGDADRPDPSTVESELRERHLPRLAETGVVEWDPGEETVDYRGHPLLERWLRETEHLD